jgi:hypothetical protein
MDETLLRANATNVLRQALDAEIGIRVRVRAPGLPNPGFRGRQTLYRFKSEDKARFGHLMVRQDPDEPGDYVWIIRTDTGFVANPDPINSPISELDSLEIDL